jgi:hypothetical protein
LPHFLFQVRQLGTPFASKQLKRRLAQVQQVLSVTHLGNYILIGATVEIDGHS